MKKAIVIGASSGIGKELAKQLADNGYKVGITGRRTALLSELKASKPDSFVCETFDAIDTKTSLEKLEKVVEELGGLDLLIFSSGIGDLNEDLDFEIEKKTIDLNVTAFTNIADWGFCYFKKQGYGHFVAISSVAGLRGSRVATSYNASKSYQINYLEGLRQKSKKLKKAIYITDIRPGLVDTDMAKGEGLFWVMPVKKAGKQILKAIKKRKKVAIVTKRWRIIAFLLKIMPRFVYDKM
jgi:short-subunit dehydrogenase